MALTMVFGPAAVNTQNSGAAITLGAANAYSVQDITLTAATPALTLPTANAGESFALVVRQDASGNRVPSWVGTSASQLVGTGDKAALVSVGSTHEMWYQPSAGSWSMLGSGVNAAHASGMIGMDVSNTRVDALGGGAIVTPSATRSRMLMGVGA